MPPKGKAKGAPSPASKKNKKDPPTPRTPKRKDAPSSSSKAVSKKPKGEPGDGGRVRLSSPGVPGPRVTEPLRSRGDLVTSAMVTEVYMRWCHESKSDETEPPRVDKTCRAMTVWLKREFMQRPTLEDFPNALHAKLIEQGLQVGFIREIVPERTSGIRDGFRKHKAYNVEFPVLLLPLIETPECEAFASLFERDVRKFWRQVLAYCRSRQMDNTTPCYFGDGEELDETLPWDDFRLGIIDGANRHNLCFDPEFDFRQVQFTPFLCPMKTFMLLM